MANGTIGNALTAPVAPVPGAQRQADPGLWRRFLTNLGQDPRLQQALMTTGLTLMGDPRMGESGFGTFSRAALTGMDQLNRMRELDRRAQLESDQLALRKKDVTSSVEARAARTAQGDRQLEISERGQGIDVSQFNNRMSLAREQMANALKIAETRAGAVRDAAETRAAGGADITGAERLENARVEALVAAYPELYPATDEGRGKARALVAGITGVGPDVQARTAQALLIEMMKSNVFRESPLTPEDMVSQANELAQLISEGTNLDNTQEVETPTDTLDGATANYKGQQVTIVKIGEDQYAVVDAAGNQSQAINRAQAEALRGAGGN